MYWTLTIGSLTLGLFDFIAIGIMLIGAISCAAAGFSRSAAKSFGFILSFPIALLFTNSLAEVIAKNGGISMFLASLISFTALSIVIYILFFFVGKLLKTSLEVLHLGIVDSILGFIWGIAIAAIAISIIAVLIGYQPFINVDPLLENSILFRTVFSDIYPGTIDILKEAVSVIS